MRLSPEDFYDRISRFHHLGGLRLDGAEWSGDEACFTIAVSRWDGLGREARFQIKAAGVEELRLDTSKREEGLHEITLDCRDPILRDFGPWASLFIDQPVPNPAEFFLEFYAGLRDACARREPLDYLCFSDLEHWLEEQQLGAFPLVTGPADVVDLAQRLLDEQGVSYRLSPGSPRPRQRLFILQLEETWAICRRAWLERDEQACRELQADDSTAAAPIP